MVKLKNLMIIGCVILLTLFVGCSNQSATKDNKIYIATSEGRSYLDACRKVMFDQNWKHVKESGTTINGETTIVMIGSSEGKKVYFTLPPAKSKTSSLEVTTEAGFPLQPAQVLELVNEEYNK